MGGAGGSNSGRKSLNMSERFKIALYVLILLPCVSWFAKNPGFTFTHLFPIWIIAVTVIKLVIEHKISKQS